MLDIVSSYLIKNYPQIAGYAVLIIICVFITSKFCKFYFENKKVINEFPNLKETLGKIDRGLTTLNQILLEKTVITQSCYSNENSPRVINELGKQLFVESRASKLFQEINQELIAELESKKFDSLLELERSSLSVLIEKMNDPRFKDIQNFAFEHPTYQKQALTYMDILFVMSLKLRDVYIEKHPDSNLGEYYIKPIGK